MNKKKNEKIYTFNDEENLIIKSNDISNCIIDKTSSCVQSIKESKNLERKIKDFPVVQLMRVCLYMQGTRFQALV